MRMVNGAEPPKALDGTYEDVDEDTFNMCTECGEQMMNNPDKGLKHGSCNVTACQRPGAEYFNKSTRAYYCEDCAREINKVNRSGCMELYGTPLLCEKE